MLSELELRFNGKDQEILCALGTSCHSETPHEESFSRGAKFHKIVGEILESEQKIYASFRIDRDSIFFNVFYELYDRFMCTIPDFRFTCRPMDVSALD